MEFRHFKVDPVFKIDATLCRSLNVHIVRYIDINIFRRTSQKIYFQFYNLTAEGPGVAREKYLKTYFWKKNMKKYDFFQPIANPTTRECPKKISAQMVQTFGRLYAKLIYTIVLLYYIEDNQPGLQSNHFLLF